ncbi:hypothetical protein C7M84_002412 [Penaeus vannamei]|uniref:Uncharacterized protein n=1 Tax=Penaeus vannamei TaxID=6689 RepID=A0A423TQZ2_PENVA|nr:hypothetical protein C7M84_002412 [Penaeus vannamei]
MHCCLPRVSLFFPLSRFSLSSLFLLTFFLAFSFSFFPLFHRSSLSSFASLSPRYFALFSSLSSALLGVEIFLRPLAFTRPFSLFPLFPPLRSSVFQIHFCSTAYCLLSFRSPLPSPPYRQVGAGWCGGNPTSAPPTLLPWVLFRRPHGPPSPCLRLPPHSTPLCHSPSPSSCTRISLFLSPSPPRSRLTLSDLLLPYFPPPPRRLPILFLPPSHTLCSSPHPLSPLRLPVLRFLFLSSSFLPLPLATDPPFLPLPLSLPFKPTVSSLSLVFLLSPPPPPTRPPLPSLPSPFSHSPPLTPCPHPPFSKTPLSQTVCFLSFRHSHSPQRCDPMSNAFTSSVATQHIPSVTILKAFWGTEASLSSSSMPLSHDPPQLFFLTSFLFHLSLIALSPLGGFMSRLDSPGSAPRRQTPYNPPTPNPHALRKTPFVPNFTVYILNFVICRWTLRSPSPRVSASDRPRFDNVRACVTSKEKAARRRKSEERG